MKTIRFALLAIAFACATSLAFSQNPPSSTASGGQNGTAVPSGDPSKVVAVVNGVEIRGDEYVRRMERLGGVGTLVGKNFVELQPGVMTLNQLISEHLLLSVAEERGVAPKDAEVEEAYRDRLTDQPNLERNWVDSGHTIADLKYQLRLEVAKFKILTQGINITDQEVQTEYETKKQEFTVPKLVKLRLIAVNTEADKNAVEADLAAGKSFAEVARARSLDISRVRDGDYGTVPLESLSKTIQDGLKATKLGGTTGWLPLTGPGADGSTLMKFLYENVIPERLLPLDDNLRNRVRKSLMLQKGALKGKIEQIMLEARHKAKIDIKDPVFASAFNTLLKKEAERPAPAAPEPNSPGQNSPGQTSPL